MANDRRTAVSWVIAAIIAGGETVVNRIYHVGRGYEQVEEKVQKLGAKIKRIQSR